eukprot:9478661-Pyramimonas_sp.AAC.1
MHSEQWPSTVYRKRTFSLIPLSCLLPPPSPTSPLQTPLLKHGPRPTCGPTVNDNEVSTPRLDPLPAPLSELSGSTGGGSTFLPCAPSSGVSGNRGQDRAAPAAGFSI